LLDFKRGRKKVSEEIVAVPSTDDIKTTMSDLKKRSKRS
jgi:hypothetical protein